MTSMPVIETTDLNKSYGQVAAVRALSFSVKPHQITAFLGIERSREKHDDQDVAGDDSTQ